MGFAALGERGGDVAVELLDPVAQLDGSRFEALHSTVGRTFDRGARGRDHPAEFGRARVGCLRQPVLGASERFEELVLGDHTRGFQLARVLVRRRSQLRFEPGRGSGERLLQLLGRDRSRRIGARDARLERLRRLGDLVLEIREALLERPLGGFAARHVPVELGEALIGERLDPDGPALVIEAA